MLARWMVSQSPFDGKSAEMHDAFDAGDDVLDLRGIGEIGGDKIVAGGEIGWRADVARAQMCG